MRTAWTTDIHLDALADKSPTAVRDFFTSVFNSSPESLIITGDIATADLIEECLTLIDRTATCPVYFVCGNHDFYGGSVPLVRDTINNLCTTSSNLTYLTHSGVKSLTPDTALVGHDGWYDGYLGDPRRSSFLMTDWFRISEFIDAGATTRFTGGWSGGQSVNLGVCLAVARKLAAEAAAYIEDVAAQAADTHRSVIIATHVPPWEDAHVHQSMKGEPGAMPWYTSKLMGDAIERVAASHPNTEFTVLCGHTHGQKSHKVSHNLVCHVGHSDYGAPVFNTVVIR